MSEQIKKQLRWFLRNLDFLIEDYELEQQGIDVKLYFDTLDVKGVVLGIHSFYIAGGFDSQKIQMAFQAKEGSSLKDRTLVLCLAFSGRLGKINLLPPHQSEFLDLLNKDFYVDYNVPPSQWVRQFLQAISQTQSIKKEVAELPDISYLNSESDEDAIEHALKHAGKHAAFAMHFYKMIQLVRGVTWQKRLQSLYKQVLDLNPHYVDYEEIIHKKNFSIFYENFTLKRGGGRWASNFADAIALTMLASQVERVTKTNTGPVPRFFVSEPSDMIPLFSSVLKDTGLSQCLEYTIPGAKGWKKSSTAIREADYFIFKSTFQPANSSIHDEDKSGFTTPEELYELRKEIAGMLDMPSSLTPADLAKIVVSGKALHEVLEDLNTLLFFKNVWLPSSDQDVELVLDELKRATDELKSEALKHDVDEQIQECKISLAENGREYEKLKHIWRRMEDALKLLRMRWSERIPYKMDYLRDFGLLRFSFPESATQTIHVTLDELISGVREGEPSSYTNIVTSCYLAQFESPEHRITDTQLNNLIAAAAVFWVANMYEHLVDLLSKIKPLPHYSLELIYAAALLEANQDNQDGPAMLELLENKHAATNGPKEKADLAVGIAYLEFRLWRNLGYGPLWDQTGNQFKSDGYGTALVNKAIDLAFEAWNTLGNWDKKKEIYALNQYLYYLISQGDENKLKAIHKAAGVFLGKRMASVTELWQHRFDDTLAHYYHLLAVSELTQAGWKENMNKAVYYASEASTKAPWHKESITYLHILQNQQQQGFKMDANTGPDD